jgi:hypothetical protein
MRGSSHTLGVALSLLMASTLVSGSICDLNCLLNEENSYCHRPQPGPTEPGMEMVELQRGNNPSAYAGHKVPGHCRSRQPIKVGGKSEPAMPLPCKTSLPCGHRGCARFLASTRSLPGAVSAWVGSPLTVAMIPSVQIPFGSLGRTRFESPPPLAFPVEHPCNVLRI